MQKVAIVTGAARGIGLSIAETLAQDGYFLALVDIQGEQLIQIGQKLQSLLSKEAKVLTYKVDVGQDREVHDCVTNIINEFGTVTVLVNNAAVGGPFHKADEVSYEEWDWIVRTNLYSVFSFCSRVLPLMKEQHFGRIINIASIQGFLGASHSSSYVATKHGTIGYTKSIAAEFGEYNITANAICPGYVDTKLGVQEEQISDYMQSVLQKSPVKRIAQPGEISRIVKFLASEESGYINGASMVVDGGISCHVGIT